MTVEVINGEDNNKLLATNFMIEISLEIPQVIKFS